jgi:hypothetical protein
MADGLTRERSSAGLPDMCVLSPGVSVPASRARYVDGQAASVAGFRT